METAQLVAAEPVAARTSRIAGVDVARALAVFGMFAAHIGPAVLAVHAGGPAEVLGRIGDGHASILFALLAGVSLALLTGGRTPHQGAALRRDRVRIAVRAVLLFVLGLALTQWGAPIFVILAFYGAYFLIALPFLRLSPRTLALIAAGWAVAGPLVSFLIRRQLPTPDTLGETPSFTTLFGPGFGNLLLDGVYPVVTWMPFVFAGLAVGRLDLRSAAVRLRVLGTGLGLAALGIGGSWLALHAFGGIRLLAPVVDAMRPLAQRAGQDPLDMLLHLGGMGYVPANNAGFLLVDSPHSGTPFEIVGSTGIALAVLALCLFAADALGRLLAPIAAVGALSLTVYTGQAIALKYVMKTLSAGHVAHPWLPWLTFVAVSVLVCALWRPLLGRGPLEALLHWVSTRIANVTVRREPAGGKAAAGTSG
ncbi:heparan-alpha-glucosaminide N-acetyltransferase domain-containing protein [Amycolatopsis jiangsuensis]|uniref:Putative membrane protein YeiB n=1 Tax=Amycolatopsis jiangsuensis TaxID=1181879 RepID=A0A840IY46_9PSEU|nr:heparan-alpha-glucosaminide N-acetyltransferase domain-containing protein [Amycolatopsis jiangsuensis]MBB4686623.1 putative membrane protein YeiB [Amycolatopsis jiangsuensis]